jgi:hypothetical protein
MAPEYDVPVLENEEMWSQRVIDETEGYLWIKIERQDDEQEK